MSSLRFKIRGSKHLAWGHSWPMKPLYLASDKMLIRPTIQPIFTHSTGENIVFLPSNVLFDLTSPQQFGISPSHALTCWPMTCLSGHWSSVAVSKWGGTLCNLYWWDGLGSETLRIILQHWDRKMEKNVKV